MTEQTTPDPAAKVEVDVSTDSPEEQPFFVARTQKDFDKKAGDLRSEGRQAATNNLLKELGLDSVDSLKNAVTEYRTIQQATETEVEALQRQAKEKDDAIVEANRLRAEAEAKAEQTLANSKLETALVGAGVDSKRLAKIIGDGSLPAPKVEDGKVAGVEAFVAAAKQEYPEWFGVRQTVPVTPNGNRDDGKGVAQGYLDKKYGANKD